LLSLVSFLTQDSDFATKPRSPHILSTKKKKESIDFRLRIEMADNFTSQTFFEEQQ